jgi:hypothetical protein
VQGGGSGTVPVSDFIYTISPTLSLNQTTTRQQLALIYSPGFTFYQKNSTLNASNQNANLNFQYRLSPHTSISLNDSFQKSSNAFDQLYPLSGTTISGSTQSPSAEVVAPYADRLSNTANMGFGYQFSRNRMIGIGGAFAVSNYPNPAEAAGLYNSNSWGSSIFYSQRLSSKQYMGLTYQYIQSRGNPVNGQDNLGNTSTEVQTQTVLPFYTIYFSPKISLSISAGPQHYDATQAPLPSIHSWTPSIMASIGWQTSHTNLAASYSRTVSASTGLDSASDSNTTSAAANWQIARTWSTGLGFSYFSNKSVGPVSSTLNSNGHTVSGTISVQHALSENFRAELGYTRLQQSYSGIAAISTVPDSDREFISVTYQLTRPLGR